MFRLILLVTVDVIKKQISLSAHKKTLIFA